jgi:transposase
VAGPGSGYRRLLLRAEIRRLDCRGARRTEWNLARMAARIGRPSPLARVRQDPAAQLIKPTRWALLNDPASWTEQQREQIAQLRRTRHVLFRAWALTEELRDLYRLPPGRRADAHLDAWLAHASRSRIPAMLDLSRTVRKHREHIFAVVELGGRGLTRVPRSAIPPCRPPGLTSTSCVRSSAREN